MPEEVLDTRNEKVKDVEPESKDSPFQKFVKKLSENKFFASLIKATKKAKEAKAKSADNKNKKATAKKEATAKTAPKGKATTTEKAKK